MTRVQPNVNITDADIGATIQYCTQLCATGGTVVWTRNRREPDLVPQVCAGGRD